MADRMIYIYDGKHPRGEPEVEVLTTAEFSAALAEGWEVVTQTDGKPIPWKPSPPKPVLGERTILRRREENRGLAVAGGERRAGSDVVTLRDDYGRTRTISTAEAMGESMRQLALSLQQQAQGACHLGAPGRHDIPGVTVISAEIVAKAFDVGMQAGIAGAAKDSNPFPPGTDAHTIWLRGYHKGTTMPSQQPGQGELDKAYADGLRTVSEFGPDDEVTCPYRGHLKAEWERGYKEAGGKFI